MSHAATQKPNCRSFGQIIVRNLIYTTSTRAAFIAVAFALCGSQAAMSQTAPAYTFSTVSYAGANVVELFGVNNVGLIVGAASHVDANSPSSDWTQGFIYNNGVFTNIDAPQASRGSIPVAVNNNGIITGVLYPGNDRQYYQGFLDSGGAFAEFACATPSETYPRGINDLGTVVGSCILGYPAYQASFIYKNGVATILYLGSGAFGINNNGEISGCFANLGCGVLQNTGTGQFKHISGPPGCYYGAPSGINNVNAVIVNCQDSAGFNHGYLYTNGVYTIIDYPGATQTFPIGINDSGVIVGFYAAGNNYNYFGFIATPTSVALRITTTCLPNAISGQTYSTTLASVGGQGTVTWSFAPGDTLPDGFTLSGAGVLSSTGSPSAKPYTYNFRVHAMDSAGASAEQSLALVVELTSGFCPSSPTTISNVVLPKVTIASSGLFAKSYQITYGAIGLNFVTDTPVNPSVACEAQGTATLQVYFNHQLAISPGVNLFDSQATVTLSLLNPGSTGTLQTCLFSLALMGSINNQCILNGAYDPNAYYMRWATPGFDTVLVTPSGNKPIGLGTGPLTFWVNLDNLGFSTTSDTMDSVLRTVEPYIHTTLIANLPKLPGAVYTILQDPGSVKLAVVNSNGLTAGTLPDGVTTFDIPLSFVYQSPSNPAVLLGHVGVGTYLVILTGTVSGEYELGVSTQVGVNANPQQTATGYLTQGASVGYQVTIANSSRGPTQTVSPAIIVPGDLNGDGTVNCFDVDIVKASFNRRTGQAGFNAWADVNHDGVVNILDLAFVSQRMQAGTVCH